MKNKKLIIFILLLLFISGCRKVDKVNPPEPTPTQMEVENKETLHIIYITGGNTTFMIERWEKIAEYLTEATGISVVADMAETYDNFIEAFKEENADIAYMGGRMYVNLKKEFDIIPLVSPEVRGQTPYRSYIVVKEDSGINTVQDLKGKSFSFVNKQSTSGYLIPRLMMLEAGIENIDKFFSHVEYTQDHLSCLIAVYNGYTDGAALSEFVYKSEEAEKYKGIKIIMESEKIPPVCIAVRKDLNPEYIEKIKKAFLDLGKTPETKEVLTVIKVDKFVEAKDSDYDPIRKAMEKLSKYEEIAPEGDE